MIPAGAAEPRSARVTEASLRRAARVIVMAERGRDTLVRPYGARRGIISVIPHGVPDRAFADPADIQGRFGWDGRDVILTFGLLSPGKGIETMIAALPAIVERDPKALYVVLGATHPNLVAHEGEAYRDRLKAQAAELGVGRTYPVRRRIRRSRRADRPVAGCRYLRDAVSQSRTGDVGHPRLRSRRRQGSGVHALRPRDRNLERRAWRAGRFRRCRGVRARSRRIVGQRAQPYARCRAAPMRGAAR